MIRFKLTCIKHISVVRNFKSNSVCSETKFQLSGKLINKWVKYPLTILKKTKNFYHIDFQSFTNKNYHRDKLQLKSLHRRLIIVFFTKLRPSCQTVIMRSGKKSLKTCEFHVDKGLLVKFLNVRQSLVNC